MFAACIKHHLVASLLEVTFNDVMPVGLRKPLLGRPVTFLAAQWPTAVIGPAPSMLPLSASTDHKNSVSARLCARAAFAWRMIAVINIVITPISVVTLVSSSEMMHRRPLAVAIARTVFVVFQERVMTTLVLLML
jgi:hypothetical protein